MTLDAIKSKILSEIDKNREQIISIGKAIFEHPEVGYYEEKTSKLVRDKFEELGIEYQYPLALTGVKGTLKGRNNEANVCVIGELDAVRCDAFHRSCKGAAQMIGASVEFEGIPGYLPLKESEGLSDVFEEVCIELIGKENMVYGEPITGSTDMGDVSYIMPAIQPSVGGFVGSMHSKEFEAVNEDAAYLLPVKAMALTVAKLLDDHAKKAKNIKNDFKPLMSKNEYLEYLKQI